MFDGLRFLEVLDTGAAADADPAPDFNLYLKIFRLFFDLFLQFFNLNSQLIETRSRFQLRQFSVKRTWSSSTLMTVTRT